MGFGEGSRARCGPLAAWRGSSALRPSVYIDGARPGRNTLHCASASRDGGRRNARHAAFPAPGRPIRGCAAARRAISLLSARHIDGRWSLDQKALGRAAATGAGLCPTWQRSQRRDAGRWASWDGCQRNDLPLRALPPCDSMAYIDASRSNAWTLSALLWRISGLRDFRAERFSQAIATSHDGEDERFDGGCRGPGPLSALAICVLFDRVEDAKGHSAGHSKAP